ncbi:hypothetical protein MASR1M60_09970 [Rhodocyclaceae bacterium]
MTDSPKISFVVPLFNHLAETREMLASLQASLPEGLDYEIILADDASTDDTAAWLKTQRDPRIKVLVSETNRGYATTNNAGVRLAKGEILGLLNNDLLFDPGWLEPMLTVLQSPELKAGLVGNVQYRVADGAVDHAGVALIPEGQFHHVQTLPNKPHVKALAVTGACMLLRKADFEAVGGFDENFVNGCEDLDLCLKLRAAGNEIYLASESRIRHHVSLSRKTNTLQDLRNSRHLFARWRSEIKRELSEVWRGLLAAGPAAYADKLSGLLAADFLSTPHAASRVIAEAMLRREASFWASKLGDAGPHVDLAGKVRSHGLRFSPEHAAHLLENSAEFVIEGLQYARNFYVCGRRIDDLSQPVTLTIHVNGLQTIKIPLKDERNVNVGLTNPLLLPGIANTFHVETDRPLLLTHLVIDDRVVDL